MLENKGDKCIKNRLLYSMGGRRWDDLRIVLKHIHYHMQNRWSVGVWCMMQHPKLVLCDNLDECGGGVGGLMRDGVCVCSTSLC